MTYLTIVVSHLDYADDIKLLCLGWRFGVAVTRWSRSTQLLYIEPGWYWDG